MLSQNAGVVGANLARRWGTHSGTPENLEYDLVTTLSNLLQGEEHLTKYAQDAEQAGNHECAQAFQTLRDNNRKSAEQLRGGLARLLSRQTG